MHIGLKNLDVKFQHSIDRKHFFKQQGARRNIFLHAAISRHFAQVIAVGLQKLQLSILAV